VPTLKFSMKTSAVAASLATSAAPSGTARSTVTERLPRLTLWK
jgi:hypothetical protein